MEICTVIEKIEIVGNAVLCGKPVCTINVDYPIPSSN